MKKLLIVSLFLLSMIGLFAQGSPYNLQFFITDSNGEFFPDGTFGFKAVQFNNFMGGEMWSDVVMYYNYPENSDQNTGDCNYNPANGQFLVQMAPFTNWGVFGTTTRFWFIDSFGTETGPYEVSKLPGVVDGDVYPDVIAWGLIPSTGPVIEWCTDPSPADGAVDVSTTVTLSATSPAESEASVYDIYYRVAGAVDWVTLVTQNFEPSMQVFPALAYSTEYEWKIEPIAVTFVDEEAVFTYKDGDAPVWSFTTMAEPIPYPTWATYATPAEDAEGVAIDASLTWTYDGPAVDGYEVWVNGFEQGDVTEMEFVFPEDLNYNTEYTWGVVPFILEGPEPGKKASKGRPVAVKRYPEGHNYGDAITTWSFTTTNVIPSDDPIVIENPNPVITDIPVIPAGLEYIAVTVNQPTAGLFGIQFTLPQAYGVMRVLVGGLLWSLDTPDANGQWAEVDGLNVTVWILFAGGAKEAKDIVIVDDSTLPVELSSFTAVAHADEYVTLNWVTESESNLYGFNVYRAETDNQDQAIRINPTTVAPNNTTQTTNYTYTDNEVEATTYY